MNKRKSGYECGAQNKYVKTIILVSTIVFIFVISITAFADSDDENDGNYLTVYYIDSQNGISYNMRYQKDFEQHPLDLTNLNVYTDLVGNVTYGLHFAPEDDIAHEIRINLLGKGHATIIKSDLALPEEIEAENSARESGLGIWGESGQSAKTNSPNAQKISEFMAILYSFVLRVWNNRIVKWVVASVLSFSAIVSYIKHYIKQRRVLLFFGGEKGAGKTTLKKAIMNPDLPEDELKIGQPTRTDSRQRFIRDDAQRKITIISDMVDIPGDGRHYVLNYLASPKYKVFRKSILIIVVAPTRAADSISDRMDHRFIQAQEDVIRIFWTAIIKARPTKVREVILFINKKDLCKDSVDLQNIFECHTKLLKNACSEAGISFVSVIGSSVKRNGFQIILDEIKKR